LSFTLRNTGKGISRDLVASREPHSFERKRADFLGYFVSDAVAYEIA